MQSLYGHIGAAKDEKKRKEKMRDSVDRHESSKLTFSSYGISSFSWKCKGNAKIENPK